MIKTSTIFWGIVISATVGFAWKFISEKLNEFRFKVVGYGIPNFNNWVLKLPVLVQFNNPTGMVISADQVIVDVYIKDASGQFSHIGQVNQPISLSPGKTTQTVVPTMNLSAIGGTLSSTWKDIISTRSATIRTDLSVIFQGLKLPAQKYTDVIKV